MAIGAMVAFAVLATVMQSSSFSDNSSGPKFLIFGDLSAASSPFIGAKLDAPALLRQSRGTVRHC